MIRKTAVMLHKKSVRKKTAIHLLKTERHAHVCITLDRMQMIVVNCLLELTKHSVLQNPPTSPIHHNQFGHQVESHPQTRKHSLPRIPHVGKMQTVCRKRDFIFTLISFNFLQSFGYENGKTQERCVSR